MATCKDCVHFVVCDSGRHIGEYIEDEGVYSEGVEKECEGFKDEQHFIYVPCKIGDTVYVVCEDDEGNFIQENKVTEVCTKGFYVSCYVPPEDDLGLLELYEDIGKTIFFEKEKAEQKLKEISYEQTKELKSSG